MNHEPIFTHNDDQFLPILINNDDQFLQILSIADAQFLPFWSMMMTKELSLCHTLKFSNSYILATWPCKPLIFQA